jgi:two-component system, OmpR family, alkaline phosphatase synthesis response regulator PhoP
MQQRHFLLSYALFQVSEHLTFLTKPLPSLNRRTTFGSRQNDLEADTKAVSGRILIVEDDAELAQGLRDLVIAAGYCAETAHDGESAIQLANATTFDVILIDAGLPDVDGFSVCTTLRESKVDAPVIFLSGNSATPQKIKALDLGADDFMAKPFVIEELLARIAALLRRYRATKRHAMTQFQLGTMHIDFLTSTVTRAGVPIGFSAKELQLLRYLMERRNCVVSRESLLKDVWGYLSVDTRTVDVHVATIRQKLEEDPQQPRHIVTLRRKGYMFVD